MKAAWYEQQGTPSKALIVGEMPIPEPGDGEVRIRVAASGVNPGDVKKRQDAFGLGMPYRRVIPHSDGAGVIDKVGRGVPESRVGERVWCYGAQSYRPFGTAAEYVALPSEQAVTLPDNVSLEQGACLGIPGITAHRAVHVGGPVAGLTVLVQGGAGAVGQCALGLARHSGAVAIATVRSDKQEAVARRAGANHVIRTDGMKVEQSVERIRAHVPDGIDHVVEVAFSSNIGTDAELLKLGGSIATHATGDPSPSVPFWPLVFKNIRLFFLGSDDFPAEAKSAASGGLNEILKGGWPGLEIEARLPLESIAEAHRAVEEKALSGRVVVTI